MSRLALALAPSGKGMMTRSEDVRRLRRASSHRSKPSLQSALPLFGFLLAVVTRGRGNIPSLVQPNELALALPVNPDAH